MSNKFFSKALFYDERKNMINSFISYGLAYLLFLISLHSFTSSNKFILVNDQSLKNSFDPSSIIFSTYGASCFFGVAICLTVVLYSYTNKHRKYMFLLTQPFSRDAIVITKTAAFIVSYTIPLILFTILSIIMIVLNPDLYYNHQNSAILLILKLNFTLFIIFTFTTLCLQLMQMLFGKTGAVIAFPIVYFLIFMIDLGFASEFVSKKIPFLSNLINSICISLYNKTSIIIADYLQHGDIFISFILLIISAAALLLTINLNRHIKAERTSDYFFFRSVKIAFKVLLAIFIAAYILAILCVLAAYGYREILGRSFTYDLMAKYKIQDSTNITQTIYLILDILFIPLSILAYKILGLFMDKKEVLEYASNK